MIVIKTSIFPAQKDEVFNKLQKLKLFLWTYERDGWISARGYKNTADGDFFSVSRFFYSQYCL